MSRQDRVAVGFVAAVWTTFVVVAAFLQGPRDAERFLLLGLMQEILLIGVCLLIHYLFYRSREVTYHGRHH